MARRLARVPLLQLLLAIGAITTATATATADVIDSFASPSLSRSLTCRPKIAHQGALCTGLIASYPRPIAFLLPPGYRQTDRADLILYLHGTNPKNQGLDSYLGRFALEKALKDSGRNAILVFPLSFGDESSGVADYRAKLIPPASFSEVLRELLGLMLQRRWIARAELGRLTLAGHSGAFAPMAALVSHPLLQSTLREVISLDANYGHFGSFAGFAGADPERRYWSAYTPHERRGVSCIQLRLGSLGVRFQGCPPTLGPDCTDDPDTAITHPAGKANPDCVPGPAPPEPEEIAAARALFWPSTVDHSATVDAFFPVFLKASAIRAGDAPVSVP